MVRMVSGQLEDFPSEISELIGGFIDDYWLKVRARDWWNIPFKKGYSVAVVCHSKEYIEWLRERGVPWNKEVLWCAAVRNPEILWWLLARDDSPRAVKTLAGPLAFANRIDCLERLSSDEFGYYWFEPSAYGWAIEGKAIDAIRWLYDPKTGLKHGGAPQTGSGRVPIPRNLDTLLGIWATPEIFRVFYDEFDMKFISVMKVILAAKRFRGNRDVLIKYLEERFEMNCTPHEEPRYTPRTEKTMEEQYEELRKENKVNHFFFWKCLTNNELRLAQRVHKDFKGNPPGWSSHCYGHARINDCVDVFRWLEKEGCPRSSI